MSSQPPQPPGPSTAAPAQPLPSQLSSPPAPCPLALEQFSTVDIAAKCPVYDSLISNPALVGPLSADHEQRDRLHAELEYLRSTESGERARLLQEEIVKVEKYLKQARAREKAALAAAGGISTTETKDGAAGADAPSSSGTVPTIKLKLALTHDDGKSGSAARRRRDSTDAKRKRGQSADTDASDSDAAVLRRWDSSQQTESPTPAKDKQKKQRLQKERSGSTPKVSQTPEQSSIPPPSFGDTKIKPSQQIPNTTFWNYVDPHFRLITDDDLAVLEHDTDDPSPFIIPPLGRHYLEQWTEEDKALAPAAAYEETITSTPRSQSSKSKKAKAQSAMEATPPPTSTESFCGPLTERLVSALLEDDDNAGLIPTDNVGDSDDEDEDQYERGGRGPRTADRAVEEMYDVEERLKLELRFIGLLDDEDEAAVPDGTDEISLELWRLQNDLRSLIDLNSRRLGILRDRAMDEMALQEYNLVLDEINRQVDQAYQKRARNVSKKKKRPSGGQKVPGDASNALLDRRKRLINEFAPIFTPASRFGLPRESLFGDETELIDSISYFKHVTPPPRLPPPSANASSASLNLNAQDVRPLSANGSPANATVVEATSTSASAVPTAPSRSRKKATPKSTAEPDSVDPSQTNGQSASTAATSATTTATTATAPAPKKPRKPRPPKSTETDPNAPPKPPRRPPKKKSATAAAQANAASTNAATTVTLANSAGHTLAASQDTSQLIGSALEDLFASTDKDMDADMDADLAGAGSAASSMFMGGSQGMVPDWMLG